MKKLRAKNLVRLSLYFGFILDVSMHLNLYFDLKAKQIKNIKLQCDILFING
jgi:hypothetical protein